MFEHFDQSNLIMVYLLGVAFVAARHGRGPSALAAVLVKNADKVVTQRQLLKEVWGPGSLEESHYLRVYMPSSGTR